MHGREGLIARIRQIHRARATADEAPRPISDGARPDELRALEDRIAHLEALVQGLQDSVHRESTRQSQRIAELEARIDPTAMHKALSENARQRGL